ncbi:unnamed protein product [Microthlaspi erraticum]|uniref:Uncharacterized protein n=1 Tax=Microthlaspi erraticum TaxID=1685480 RepID=A0A6D2I8B5_9BRAS|nr:unnamed protein product [Microthlaspi erraticum]
MDGFGFVWVQVGLSADRCGLVWVQVGLSTSGEDLQCCGLARSGFVVFVTFVLGFEDESSLVGRIVTSARFRAETLGSWIKVAQPLLFSGFLSFCGDFGEEKRLRRFGVLIDRFEAGSSCLEPASSLVAAASCSSCSSSHL